MRRQLVVLIFIGVLGATAASGAAAKTLPATLRLTSKPPAVTQKTTARFVVAAPQRARLRCRLDVRKPWACGKRITLKGLAPGKHRLTVRGTWRGRALQAASFAWRVVAPAAPAPIDGTPAPPAPPLPTGNDTGTPTADLRPTLTTPPIISGAPMASASLFAVQGVWTGATKVVRRWQRCDAAGGNCADVPNETADWYLVTSADAGRTIRVVETASNASGSRDAASAPSTVVPAPPVNTVAPSISGFSNVGETLTGHPGTWTGENLSFSYQWLRCAYLMGAGCTTIGGATGLTYVVQDEDLTQFIVFVVVANGGPAGTTLAASKATGEINPAP